VHGSPARTSGREGEARNRLGDDCETGASANLGLRFLPARRGPAEGKMAR